MCRGKRPETAGGELRARVSDLWSSTVRWVLNLLVRSPETEGRHTHASCEGCDVAGCNSERSLCGECSSDRNGHGTERRQSSVVLYQARSGTREMWILQRRMRGMSCGSVGRRCESVAGRRRATPSKKHGQHCACLRVVLDIREGQPRPLSD